jgi:hypothetical protein
VSESVDANLGPVLSINFGDSSKLRVGAEDEIDAGAVELDIAGGPRHDFELEATVRQIKERERERKGERECGGGYLTIHTTRDRIQNVDNEEEERERGGGGGRDRLSKIEISGFAPSWG